MNKIRLSFIAVLIVILASLLAVGTVSASDMYDEELSFISQLGITDGISKQGTEPITREEFAAMTVRMLNADISVHKENEFRDIDGSAFIDEICTAKDMGIVSGTSSDMYSPEEYVAYQVAAKMLSSALGYSSYAEALGGYPAGYLKLASELDILDGVTAKDTAITYSDAVRLIYNTLHADTAIVTGITNDGISIETQKGRNLLTENFDLKYYEGIVTTVGYCTLDLEDSKGDIIRIDGREFKADRDYSEYFSHKCNAWYDEDRNTIVAIEKDSSNVIVEIEAKYLKQNGSLTLVAENAENTKTKQYKLDTGFTYVLNGRITSTDTDSFKIKDGTYTLIDTNGDRKYDIVLAEKKEYFVIRSISDYIRTIYDNKSDLGSICFDNIGDTDYRIWVNGISTYFGDLTENMVLEVYMSKDMKLCRIYASNKSVYGKISELNTTDNKFLLENVWYDYNSYFKKDENKIDLSKNYELFLADDGTICTYKEASDSSMQYGYFLGYKTKNGLDANPDIKLLNINNEIKIYKLSSKVKLNDKNVSSVSSEIKSALIDSAHGDIPKYQLIKYSVSNDEVTAIQTATDYTGSWLDIPTQPNGNAFTKYMSTEELKYRAGNTIGAFPNAPLSKALIFAAPYDVVMRVEGTSEFVRPDKVYTKEYEDGYFRMWTTGNLTHDSTYYMDVFDYDEEMNPAVVVVYRTKNPSAVSTPSRWLDPQMVIDVVDAIDPEGMTSKKIKTYSRTGYTETFFDASLYDSIIANAGGLPTSGDVVRLATNTYGYITGMEVDVDYDNTVGDYTIATTDYLTTADMNDEVAYIGGEAVTKPGSFFAIEAKNNPNSLSSTKFDNILNFRQSNPYYLIYNKSTGKARLGNSGDIKAKAFSGEGSDVVLRNNYNCTIAVFVYEE